MTQSQGNIDKVLFTAVMLLLAIGVVMVYSSSSVVALTTYNDPTHLMRRQIAWAALGLLAMVAAMRFDHAVLADKRVVAMLLLLSFALLADEVRKTLAAPNIHFVDGTAAFGDPALDLLDDAVKCSLVQVGVDNANQLVFTHEGFLLSSGYAPGHSPQVSRGRKASRGAA